MNWGELKEKIRDLGFEEDSTMSEYSTIVVNAANRAIDMIIHELIVPNKEYFGNLYAVTKTSIDATTGDVTTTKVKWQQPDVDPITTSTPDTEEIDLPERVSFIVPILAAHYVWLDDDQTKAMIYWNQFDDFRTRLLQEAREKNFNCDMVGGLWF